MYQYPHYNLSVFAKLPELGQVKTRMQPDFPPEFSLLLHKHLVDYVLSQWQASALCPLHLWLAGNVSVVQQSVDSASFQSHRLPVSLQQGVDLGERLASSLNQQLKQYEGVFLVGTDCPFINSSYLNIACEALEQADVVIGPAEDGGYVLLGLKQLAPELFHNIDWGSEFVFEQTMEAIKKSELNYFVLPTLPDIDRPADVNLLKKLEGFQPLWD